MFPQIAMRQRSDHGQLHGTNPTTEECSTLNHTSEAPQLAVKRSVSAKEWAKSTKKWPRTTPLIALHITQHYNPNPTNVSSPLATPDDTYRLGGSTLLHRFSTQNAF